MSGANKAEQNSLLIMGLDEDLDAFGITLIGDARSLVIILIFLAVN